MDNAMRQIIIFLSLLMTTNLYADWKINETIDSMTDKVQKNAFILSKGGHRFTLIRKSNGKVWGYLKLSRFNQFSVNDSLMLRVDKNKPREISDRFQKSIGIASYEWNPNILGFLLWHGEASKRCGTISQLLKGKKLVIRYHPNKSTYKDIVFNITKNKLAIRSALSIKNNEC